jgi:hypothetical protein
MDKGIAMRKVWKSSSASGSKCSPSPSIEGQGIISSICKLMAKSDVTIGYLGHNYFFLSRSIIFLQGKA